MVYPVLMLMVPAGVVLRRRLRAGPSPFPWTGCTLIAMPCLLDVTGNTLDLYDTVDWWDDANHLLNWFLLSAGVGVLLRPARIAPRWALGVLVAGIGALLAIVWELGEWYTFIRHSDELRTAYQDTLGDELLGVVGSTLAGLLLVRRSQRPPLESATLRPAVICACPSSAPEPARGVPRARCRHNR